MDRTARDRTGDHPRPVQRIELNEDKLHKRFILVVLLLALGVGAILYGMTRLLTTEAGWQEVQATGGGLSVAREFVLFYDLGHTGGSATAERKQLNIAYTQAAADAYQIFNAHERYEGVANLAWLSDHPNQIVTVDPGLYRALETLESAGSRILYLAPVYETYYSLFHCQDLSETVDFDPFQNPELADWCAEAAAFAADPEAVGIELLGEDRVRLILSETYAAFLREYGVTDILDLFWTRNAFVADYLADRLTEAGFTRACLSSYDGFIRDLDGTADFELNLFHRTESGEVSPAGTMAYRGPVSLVSLYSYPAAADRSDWYYVMPDATVRHPCVDVADGLCRAATPELVGYARDRGCAGTLLALLDVYTADTLDEDALRALAREGVDSVFCRDGVVVHSDPEAVFPLLYRGDETAFRAEHLGA